ncbi:MAG: radical SAM protein, partial [Deltaproteobacteria bacterium]|nr:radical SAM protein [Deltaproteobacteria bacterium]
AAVDGQARPSAEPSPGPSDSPLAFESLGQTESLCPECLKVLPARIVRRGGEIFLERSCPEHGPFSEAIWRGEPDFAKWRRPKSPAAGVKVHKEHDKGCPFDCGLCPEHAQHPCTILLEITSRCDLLCPVCYAGSGGGKSSDEDADSLIESLKLIRSQAGPVILQISGGEPTLHPELPRIVKAARLLFPAVQLNTNGLSLARDPALAFELKRAGLSWVFLQFDSLNDDTLKILRGRPLLSEKLKAVDNLEKAGQPTVLVPTVAKNLNDAQLGDLVAYALSKPMVRGLHLQPMTSSGRNSLSPSESRITLPELLRLLHEQTGGAVDPGEAFPPGCEHERCSFHLRFRRAGRRLERAPGAKAGGGRPPKTTERPSAPAETAQSRDRAVDIILRSWSPGGVPEAAGPLIPMAARPKDAFDEFLEKAKSESFSITAMAFQDAWTADLARLRGCCVHVFSPPNRFVPFCAMNLTTAGGRALYRSAP